jgi:tripartite-type tricarboxylate transporter receptor subunit TctC
VSLIHNERIKLTANWLNTLSATTVATGVIAPLAASYSDHSEKSAMKLPRRQFLHLATVGVALPPVSRIAWAQNYPTRPVRIVIGVSPGGSPDIVGRMMGQSLSKRLGQPFVIENRVGAAGNVGAEAVVRSPRDGYTLLLITVNNVVNSTLYEGKLSFDLARDIAPVGSISRGLNVMVVHPSFPARTVAEFIAYAKANPEKISMASAGIGSGPHLTGELFQMMAGIKMIHVPYRGAAPALTDLLGGQVQVYFGNPASSLAYIKDGKLRALAVTSATRSEVLPDIPAVGEFLPGFEASTWLGMGAPKNTPADIIDGINKAMNEGLADPAVKAQLAVSGNDVFASSPAEFGKLIVEETEKWGKVVRAANLKPE